MNQSFRHLGKANASLAARIQRQQYARYALIDLAQQEAFIFPASLYHRALLLAYNNGWEPALPYPASEYWDMLDNAAPKAAPQWPLTAEDKAFEAQLQQQGIQPMNYYVGDGRILLPPAVATLILALQHGLDTLPPQNPAHYRVAVLITRNDGWVELQGYLYRPDYQEIYVGIQHPLPLCFFLDEERPLLLELISFLQRATHIKICDLAVFALKIKR